MKRDTHKMDLDALDELIGKCEDKMVSPFKKSKGAVAVEIDPEDVADDGKDESDEGGDPKDLDLSDIDLQDLLEAYQSIQEQRGED